MRLRNIPAAAPAVEPVTSVSRMPLPIKDTGMKYLEMTTRSALKSAWARDALSWT